MKNHKRRRTTTTKEERKKQNKNKEETNKKENMKHFDCLLTQTCSRACDYVLDLFVTFHHLNQIRCR